MTDNLMTRPRLNSAKAIANRERRAAERDRNAKLWKLWNVIFGDDEWPYSVRLYDALIERLVGHESGPLQEWHDSKEGTLEEKRFVADLRSAWDGDAKGPLYRIRGRSPGVAQKPLAPVERDIVAWVRTERKKLHGWSQTNKLPTGKIEELIERAFVKFPDAEKLSERRKEFIRRLIDRPSDHKELL